MRTFKRVGSEYLQALRNVDEKIFEEMESAVQESAGGTRASGAAGGFSRETIVLTKGRPVLDIIQKAAVLEIAEPESQQWKQRLKDASPLLAGNIPGVGRIELANHPRGVLWLGTGWLLRDNIVVTNRHVAEVFGSSDGG